MGSVNVHPLMSGKERGFVSMGSVNVHPIVPGNPGLRAKKPKKGFKLTYLFPNPRTRVAAQEHSGTMEQELHARDKVGVQDFVLLEDYTNIDAFIDNLDRRFKEDLIYVSPVSHLAS